MSFRLTSTLLAPLQSVWSGGNLGGNLHLSAMLPDLPADERRALTELERGEHLAKRKEIYAWKYPETKHGTAQAAGMNRTLGHNVAEKFSATSFAADGRPCVGIVNVLIRTGRL